MGPEPEPPAGSERGGAFYDQSDVFERYRVHAGPSNPNLVMEEPALLDELGSVESLRVLDLGCGDATLGRVVLDAGCRSYVGIDGSIRMVHAAEKILSGTTGEVVHADIEGFSASPDAYDAGQYRGAAWQLGCGRLLRCRSTRTEPAWRHGGLASRTVETYIAAVRRAGFDLTAVRECPPRRERFGSDAAEFERRQRIPMFLLVAGVKA